MTGGAPSILDDAARLAKFGGRAVLGQVQSYGAVDLPFALLVRMGAAAAWRVAAGRPFEAAA